MELSKKSLEITPSATLAISQRAKELRAQGIDVISFTVGEPDFDTPKHIKEAAKKALDEGFTKYTDSAGIIELRKAIADKLKKDNGLDYEPAQIVVNNGAKHSLSNAFMAVLNPADEVLIPIPYWISYPESIRMADGVPVYIETKKENNYIPTLEELEKSVTKKTKAILINSPSNPTGVVYSKQDLMLIAEFAKKYDLFIISDEVYEYLVYDGAEHISIASLSEDAKNRTIVINGLSKSYSMTGWRLGYTASEPKVAKVMSNIQSHLASNVNSIAQKAALCALESSQDCVQEMLMAFTDRRNKMYQMVGEIPGLDAIKPMGAFYMFVTISPVIGKKCGEVVIENAAVFAEQLLEKEQVAIIPCQGFGEANGFRLAYTCAMAQLVDGMNRIKRFVENLN